MSEPVERVVPVVIQGQRYPIRSALDARYIADLAAYVDEKMRAAADSTSTTDSLKVAVLVALNLADEVFRCRASASSRDEAVSGRAERLERLLDQALGVPPPSDAPPAVRA